MNPTPSAPTCPDVPTQVFEKFLNALSETKESSELIERFRKILLEEKSFTERDLKEAIFGEDKIS